MKPTKKQIRKSRAMWGRLAVNCKGVSTLKFCRILSLTLALIVVESSVCTANPQAADSYLYRPATITMTTALSGLGCLILLLFAGLFSILQKKTRQAANGHNISPALGPELFNGQYQIPREGDQPLQDHHQLFFQSHPMPMLICDAKTFAFIGVNDMATRKYGYSRQEFLSLNLKDIEIEEGVVRESADLTTDVGSHKIAKHRKKSGAIIEVEKHSQDLFFEGRNALLLTTYDISKWQQAAESWEQERQLLHSVMDQLPVFIYAKDRESRFVFANLAVAAGKGEKNPEDLIGKSDFDYYPPDLATQYRAIEEEIMTKGQGVTDLEVFERDKEGNESWFSNARVPWRDRHGNVVGILGMNRKITESKQAQEQLAQEIDLMQTLMDNIPDTIYFKDTECRYLRINRAHANRFGLSDPADAIGKSVFDFFTHEHAQAAYDDEQIIIRTGQPVIGKEELETFVDKDDEWVSTTKFPLRDKDGQIIGLFGISRDITERKQSAEALEKSFVELQSIVSAVSEGDLTKRVVEGENDIGRIAESVNKMLDNFSKMIRQVKGLGLTVSSSAIQILGASEEIAVGSQRQADEITNTSAAIEEMAASMSQVSKNAGHTTEAAHQALEMAKRSDDAVGNAFEAMGRIDLAVRLTSDKMHTLAQRSSEISEILDLISGIASQTNLLSVNAAIQAAHAGDAGLGFSVVADEIRKLAERSVQSTKDINKLIKAIRTETVEALSSMDLAINEVKSGSQLAAIASQSIQDISVVVTQSASLIEEISVAAEEQARVSHNIAEAMQTVSSIAVETSTGTHETSQIMQNLVTLSEDLSDAMLKFKINE